jgi:hypothetical protein
MPRLLIASLGTFVVLVLIRFLAVGNTVTAASDMATLATLSRPAGFIDATAQRECPGLAECFRTGGLLAPMSMQNAAAVVAQFGLTVGGIRCQRASIGGDLGGLTCTGKGTVTGFNYRTVHVFFSLVSGREISVGSSSSPLWSPGTYATFSTKALKWLPLSLRLG